MALELTALQTLDPSGWANMLALGRMRSLVPGEIIFVERSQGDHLFFSVSGLVEIFKETTPGHELRLAILDPNSIFGEGALFETGYRSASARAFGEVELLEISVSDMTAFLDQHPTFALHLYRILCRRLHQIISDLDSDIKVLHRRLAGK